MTKSKTKKSLAERLGSVQFLSNTPVALLVCVLDRSGSMSRAIDANNTVPKIQGLKRGVDAALTFLRNPPGGVSPRVGFVTFGGDIERVDPVPVDVVEPPNLEAKGNTPLGAAMEAGLNIIECSLGELNSQQVPFKAPSLALFSDGIATDEDPTTLRNAMRHALQLVNDVKLQLLGLVVNAEDQRRLLDLGFAEVQIIGEEEDWTRKFRWMSLASMKGTAKPVQLPLED